MTHCCLVLNGVSDHLDGLVVSPDLVKTPEKIAATSRIESAQERPDAHRWPCVSWVNSGNPIAGETEHSGRKASHVGSYQKAWVDFG